jgi:hypothetical protein
MQPITALALHLFRALNLYHGLREVIGQYQLRNHAWIPRLNLAWGRLGRLVGRLDRLTRLWEADRLPAPRVRARRAVRKGASGGLRLPAGHGWLVKLLGPAANMSANFVNLMLQEPDARALFAAAPQAGRIFRPLCRMFGLEQPEWLRLPERARKPRAPKPPKARKERQGPARGFTRRQIDGMTVAELVAHYGRLPPHFPLPIPNLGYIRRKIAAG